MTDHAEKRGQLIRHLEDALALADEVEDGFLIERALDEARSRHFRPIGWIASAFGAKRSSRGAGPRGPRSRMTQLGHRRIAADPLPRCRFDPAAVCRLWL